MVGANRFQNELFVANLKKIQGCQCTFVLATSLSDVPSVHWKGFEAKSLVYLDCYDKTCNELQAMLRYAGQMIPPDNLLALFNLPVNTGFEQPALSYGIRGVFYPDSTLVDFCRGAQTILKGEVWLPRKVMSEILLRSGPPTVQSQAQPEQNPATLSPREKEVLTVLDTGATNKTIAAELCISVHTVRTHLYHIYKKIKVSNRSQAVLWAEKNL